MVSLLPQQLELDTLTTVTETLDWIGFRDIGPANRPPLRLGRPVRTSLYDLIGSTDVIRHIASIPAHNWEAMLLTWVITLSDDTESQPTALEIGHAGMLFKICRQKFGLPDLTAGPIPQLTPSQQVMPGQLGQPGLPPIMTQPAPVYSGVALPTLASQLAGVTPEGGLFLSKLHLDQTSQSYAV